MIDDIKPGWDKKKRPSLLDPNTTEVAYLYKILDGAPFVVTADHAGVKVRGESPLFTQGHGGKLDDFAWIMADAFREHMKLRSARIVTQH